MAAKQKKSFFISFISVFSVCLNCLKISTANDVKPGFVKLRVFTPKNNSYIFKVNLPIRINLSNIDDFPKVVSGGEAENENVPNEYNGLPKKFHLKLPGVNEVNDNVDKVRDESSFDSNKKPRLTIYLIKKKPNRKDESSSESSVTNPDYEDCDNMTNTVQNTEINQDIKNNSEDLSESESKNEISTTTLTSNEVEASGIPEEAVKSLESEESEKSGESGKLETVQKERLEPEKKSIITPTLGKDANQSNLVIVIVTASVSLILLLIILATIINHIRDRKHCDLLDIEKFQRENGKGKTRMENNHQDFYRWIKARITPSHCKGQGQNSPFPENIDPYHQEKE